MQNMTRCFDYYADVSGMVASSLLLYRFWMLFSHLSKPRFHVLKQKCDLKTLNWQSVAPHPWIHARYILFSAVFFIFISKVPVCVRPPAVGRKETSLK